MNPAQSVPVARAVGSSADTGEAVVERHSSAEVLKVSTRSRPSAVAGAIAGVIRESGSAEVQSIGAGATNQAIKAVAIARSYLNEEGVDIVCVPSFIDVSIDDEERTAIRLLIEKR
jgi:stage V sporulation protein S